MIIYLNRFFYELDARAQIFSPKSNIINKNNKINKKDI